MRKARAKAIFTFLMLGFALPILAQFTPEEIAERRGRSQGGDAGYLPGRGDFELEQNLSPARCHRGLNEGLSTPQASGLKGFHGDKPRQRQYPNGVFHGRILALIAFKARASRLAVLD